jgi:acylpyruvate hydrolase
VRIARFQASDRAESTLGLVGGTSIEVVANTDCIGLALGDTEPDRTGETYELSAVRLLAPHQPRAIFGVGLNYLLHAQQDGGVEVPAHPIIFLKGPASAAPPGGPVTRPDGIAQLDYEGELAVVMGRDGQVAGYAVADDVSARDVPDRQWARTKGGDGFCPFGPWLTTADEIKDPDHLRIRTWVNGELRQDASTQEMVFKIPELIAAIELTIALHPGDLILTGTPSGVGYATKTWLVPNDVVRMEIEGLGSIEHAIA